MATTRSVTTTHGHALITSPDGTVGCDCGWEHPVPLTNKDKQRAAHREHRNDVEARAAAARAALLGLDEPSDASESPSDESDLLGVGAGTPQPAPAPQKATGRIKIKASEIQPGDILPEGRVAGRRVAKKWVTAMDEDLKSLLYVHPDTEIEVQR